MSITMMIDPYGRTLNYLRLSVTDRCNLRCRYWGKHRLCEEPPGPSPLDMPRVGG